MTVPAADLRPRSAIAILDAALRFCSRDSGPWALTLPGAAAVTGAVLACLHAVRLHASVGLPVAALTAAWLFRGLCQMASAFYVEAAVLRERPSLRASAVAALQRLPSEAVTVGVLAIYQALVACSLGMLLFFVPGAGVAHAVTLRGEGNSLNVLATGHRLLGPSRTVALKVRWLFGAQVLVLLNLQVAVSALLYVGKALLGLDVAFLERFTQPTHGMWIATLVLVSFGLVEPLRATAAALLLVDARVRREGLGLLARVEQLPSKRPGRGIAAAALMLTLVALPAPARAADPSPPMTGGPDVDASSRLLALAHLCDLKTSGLEAALAGANSLPASQHKAMTRFADFAETTTLRSKDCPTLARRLRTLAAQLQRAQPGVTVADPATDAAGRVQSVLARPEFQTAAPQATEAESPWEQRWERFKQWLKKLLRSEAPERKAPRPGGLVVARILAWGLMLVTAAGALFALGRWYFEWRAGREARELLLTPAHEGPASATEDALSRPADAWAHAADLLSRKGDLVQALRTLYLALLARLHEEGAIDYVVSSSNWDYVRGFRGPEPRLRILRELTLRFDAAVYGHVPVAPADYAHFKDLAAPVLGSHRPTEGEAAGA